MLQNRLFTLFLKKVFVEFIYHNILFFVQNFLDTIYKLFKISFMVKIRILGYYRLYGFLYLYTIMFIFGLLFDIIYNSGYLVIISKSLPYYIILMLLQHMQNYITPNSNSSHSIISNIYYDFHNPNKRLLPVTWLRLNYHMEHTIELDINDIIPELYMEEEDFYLDKYNLYRLYLINYQKESLDYMVLINHVLTPDLTEEEKLVRIGILKSIDRYPKDKKDIINLYPNKHRDW